MAKTPIKEVVSSMLDDFLKENSLELYNTEFVKEGKDWFLRVYIDKAGAGKDEYVGTEDCEKVSRYLSEALDEKDPISQNYYLEVSSPGMDRQLYQQKDFDRFAGELVEVKLYKASNGCKEYEGILTGLIDGEVIIKVDGEDLKFPLEQVAKVNLAVVF